MRFATLVAPNKKPYFVRLKDGIATPIGRAYDRPGVDPLRVLLEVGRDPRRVKQVARPFPLKGARYGPAVTAPSKIIALGLNYRTHAEEEGMAVPREPMSWCKYTSSLLGHRRPIRFRRRDTRCADWECELAVVMGRRARDVKAAKALDYVFGYTACNDITARENQEAEGQYSRSKSFDTFTPLGPVIVTADEIPDPQTLGIRTRLNGRVMQDSNTSDMEHSCADLIAYLSRFMTLEAGDVISTGTPSGVGEVRKPPIFLKNRDVIEVEIDGIGTLRNPIRAS